MVAIQQGVLLKNYSNFKIGGPARFFTEVDSMGELKEVLHSAKQNQDLKVFVLGGGTNVLIGDEGFDGLVIYNKIVGIQEQGDGLIVGSGVLVKDLLGYCVENSLSGFEWAGGLPGTIGGAVRGNAGAFKGETKDSVVEVRSLDVNNFEKKTRANRECSFGYRDSIFKSGEGSSEFITHILLELVLGDKEEIREKIQQKIDYRNSHHPMSYPSIGSIFKNIPLDSLSQDLQKEFSAFVKTDPFPVVPTAKLLALADLKGRKAGGAMISDKHPNFIVNIDNATCQDVKALIEIAKGAVKEKYNISLEEEIIYLS
ncbi:MAG: UDP-N-acetylenolpyruvoylglucosamine reductase [Candidatus Levybacteria bacterium RIFCSPHIGHO2_02_FULL_37_10]|nr:MAG: UDP-N-acetylenolpyruvoylglucosamine reductase [Candidatus Levybacteria bacterium RIFCSPHIGHO2_02_FULL_37_10]OGH41365.1 MAG: UDP-N-acetylenolpyruvoylglucosamine reductase [Candidatus Levybacteria bacterium RIFCSPLOWO2_02_FULL_36_8b]